mgnify:CR=1 FL=1
MLKYIYKNTLYEYFPVKRVLFIFISNYTFMLCKGGEYNCVL